MGGAAVRVDVKDQEAPVESRHSKEASEHIMGMQINTNVSAINVQRNLSMTNVRLARSMEKLSSGLRINRAADDAAGLSISERLRAQVRGLTQAGRNSQEAVSMIQTAEGSLAETHSMLQRMRELAVQAGNTTMSAVDRTAIGEELLALRNEIDRVGSDTEFNGLKVLSGALTTTQSGGLVTVGATADNNTVSAVDMSGAQAGVTYTLSYVAGTDTLTLTNGTTAQAQSLVTTAQAATVGAKVYNFDQLGVSFTLTGPAESAADAIGTALDTDTVITAAGAGSAQFQVGANSGQSITVAFADMRATAIGTGAGNQVSDKIADNQAVSDTTKASTLLTVLDDAISDVSTQSGALGAVQNRVEHTIASTAIAVENLSASESRIRDADIAEVSSQLVTYQILQAAGISVLAQANQNPQAVLSLLR